MIFATIRRDFSKKNLAGALLFARSQQLRRWHAAHWRVQHSTDRVRAPLATNRRLAVRRSARRRFEKKNQQKQTLLSTDTKRASMDESDSEDVFDDG